MNSFSSTLRMVAMAVVLLLAAMSHVTQAIDSEKASGSLMKQGTRHLRKGQTRNWNEQARRVLYDDYYPPPPPTYRPPTYSGPTTQFHPALLCILMRDFGVKCPL